MTELEKKLNRVNLQAYKHYDKNVYALVPGVNSSLSSEMAASASLKYPQKRRQTFGLDQSQIIG